MICPLRLCKVNCGGFILYPLIFFSGLCRVDLLIDQILRLDPKSIAQTRSLPTSTSFSARPTDFNPPQSTNTMPIHMPSSISNIGRLGMYAESSSNGKTLGTQGQSPFPMPVLRTQPTRSTNRSSQETASFKPIEQQQSSMTSDGTSRPTPIYPYNNPSPFTEKTTSVYSFSSIILGYLFSSPLASSSNTIIWSTNTSCRS